MVALEQDFERPRGPRPLQFIRIRVYGINSAEYLQELLTEDIKRILEELSEARRSGDAETEDQLRNEMRYANDLLRDLQMGMVELVGPDRGQE